MENEIINRLGKVIFQVNDRDDGFVWTSIEAFKKSHPYLNLEGIDLASTNLSTINAPIDGVVVPIASVIELELHDGIRIEDAGDEDEVCWIEFFSCAVRDGKLVVKRRSCLSGHGGDMDYASDDYCVIPTPFVNPDPADPVFDGVFAPSGA